MIGLKSELLFPQIPDGLHHQSGAHEQREGQRKLSHHQRISQSQSAARFSASAAFLQGFLQRHFARSQRWRKTKEHSRNDRNPRGEQQHMPVQFESAACLRRHQAPKQIPAHFSYPQSQQSACSRQQQALGQQLRCDLPGGGTQGQPHRHFSSPSGRSRQQKVGQVRARNQQHKDRSHLQHQQPAPGIPCVIFLERHHHGTELCIRLRVLFLQVSGNAFHVLLRLLLCHTRLQPRDYCQEMGLPPRPLLRRETRRHPVVAVLPVAEKEILGHHANYFCLHSVQQDCPPDECLVTPEASPPHAITQHYYGTPCFVLFRRKRAAYGRLHTQHIKKVRCDLLAGELFRLAVPRQASG